MALALYAAAPDARANDVIAGAIRPAAGSLAPYGAQLEAGFEAAARDINAAGGVNGATLKLEYGDDSCEPGDAIEVAKSLASKKVAVVFGHFCAVSSIEAAKTYEAKGVVMISPSTADAAFTGKGGWNVHRVCGRDNAQGRLAGARIAKTYAGKAVAIIQDNTAYGQGLAAQAKAAMNAGGLKEAFMEAIKPGEADYLPLVGKLKAAAVDAVYFGGFHPEAALILRQMRQQGVAAQFIMGDATGIKDFWSISGDAGEGALFTQAPDAGARPNAKALLNRLNASGGSPANYTLYAYASVEVWAAAAKATRSFDGRKIATWLRAGNAAATVLGTIKMDKHGDIVDPAFAWYQWSKGEIVEASGP